MTGTPSQPSNVQVAALKKAAKDLQDLADGWGKSVVPISTDMGTCSTISAEVGPLLQDAGTHISEYYGKRSSAVTQYLQGLQTGLSALATNFTNSATRHDDADNNAKQSADAGTSGEGGGKNSGNGSNGPKGHG